MDPLAAHWPEVPKVKNFKQPPPLPKSEDGRDEAIEAVSELIKGIYDDLEELRIKNKLLQKALDQKMSIEDMGDTRKELRRVFNTAWSETFATPDWCPSARETLREKLGL